MTRSYRLRIQLPDRPGSLAVVAAAIAAEGANVVSIDIHEVDRGQAVDEIVVEAADDWDAGALATRLGRTPGIAGASLLSSSPDKPAVDPVAAALEWATSMAMAGPDEQELQVGCAIVDLCRATAGWACSVTDAMAYEAGGLALERGAPVIVLSASLPDFVVDEHPGSMWLMAAADDPYTPSLVGFAARPSSLHFTTNEIARLQALLQLRRRLAGRLAHTP